MHYFCCTGKPREDKCLNGGVTEQKNNFEQSSRDSGTFHLTTIKTKEEPLLQPSSSFTFCEEDWDNDIVNPLGQDMSSLNGGMQPSVNQNKPEKNFYIGVSGNKELFCDETSSVHSSDSEVWMGNQSRNYQAYSLHLESERDWLDALESLYFSDMITELKVLLTRAFEASENCFDFVLYIVKFADFDIQSGKKSLAYITLVEFEAWLKSKTEGRSIDESQLLGYWPTEKQKDAALDVVVSSTFLLFEPIKRTFQLDLGDNGFLTKHVRFLMHSKRRYREVS